MPAEPSPQGGFTTPVVRLAEMVADCESFQTAAGLIAPDPDAREKLIYGGLGAAQRIFFPTLELIGELEHLIERLPIAVIQLPTGWGYDKRAGGGRNFLPYPDGELELLIAARDDAPSDVTKGFLGFGNFLGNFVLELNAQSGLSDRLPYERIRLRDTLGKSSRQEEASAGGGFWSAWFTVQVGR